MDLLQFAVATIIQPSAWLFFGFGLFLFPAASLLLLCLLTRGRNRMPLIYRPFAELPQLLDRENDSYTRGPNDPDRGRRYKEHLGRALP